MTSRVDTARLAILSAAAVLFTGPALVAPALADCQQEIQSLDQAVVSAETGAATSSSGMPSTKHQEEVLSDKKKAAEEESTGSSGSVEATTEHQRQAIKGTETQSEAVDALDEARELAKAGDEQGCMDKVAEVKKLLGVE